MTRGAISIMRGEVLTWSGSGAGALCAGAVGSGGAGIIAGTGAAATTDAAPGAAACPALKATGVASDAPQVGIGADPEGPKRSAVRATGGCCADACCWVLFCGRPCCTGGAIGGAATGPRCCMCAVGGIRTGPPVPTGRPGAGNPGGSAAGCGCGACGRGDVIWRCMACAESGGVGDDIIGMPDDGGSGCGGRTAGPGGATGCRAVCGGAGGRRAGTDGLRPRKPAPCSEP